MTYSVPKAMVPLLNRPFLAHMLTWLARHEVTDVVLSTYYMPEAIENYFGRGEAFGLRVSYVQEREPLGTGGAIKNCEALLTGGELFLVLNGDILSSLDLRAMRRSHLRRGAQVTLSLKRVADPTRFGVVETDRDGRVRRFVEKPPPDQITSHYINAGVYIFSPELLSEMPPGRFSLEREFFPVLLEQGRPVFSHRIRSYWLDVGTADSYRQAHWDSLDGKTGLTPAGGELRPGVWTGPDTRLDAPIEIKPPVVLGARCSVSARASLGPYCVLGDDVTVETGAHISRSVVWSGCRIGEGSSITDSIIGCDHQIPPSSTLHGEALGEKQSGPSSLGGKNEQTAG